MSDDRWLEGWDTLVYYDEPADTVVSGAAAYRLSLPPETEAIVILTVDAYEDLCQRANDKATVTELRKVISRTRASQAKAHARANLLVGVLTVVAAGLQDGTHPQHLLKTLRTAIAADQEHKRGKLSR